MNGEIPDMQNSEFHLPPAPATGKGQLGMLLKGYPRISESFISTEILLLESLGIPIAIYSLRRPRESLSHASVSRIKAPVTYLPEYVLPHWSTLFRTNARLWRQLGARYPKCFGRALLRTLERRKPATLRHFLQAGHLAAERLLPEAPRHIHAHFCHTPTSVALFASELTGIPFSFTAHAKDIYTSQPAQLLRKISRARFVVTCTRYNADYLATLQATESTKTPIHTIYHGIDLDFFRFAPAAPPAAPPYRLLSIGRLVPKKGYDDLLRALQLLDKAGLEFQFVHIGSGELQSEIQRLVHELGLQHRVQLLGTLPHEQVIAHYHRAHCFVLACKVASNGDRDGIPNVLVEAMAVGVPVVSTRVSAIPELIVDGVTGTLVESQQPAAMARALQAVLCRPGRYRQQVRQARLRVEGDFDNQRCIQRLHALFQDTLDTA